MGCTLYRYGKRVVDIAEIVHKVCLVTRIDQSQIDVPIFPLLVVVGLVDDIPQGIKVRPWDATVIDVVDFLALPPGIHRVIQAGLLHIHPTGDNLCPVRNNSSGIDSPVVQDLLGTGGAADIFPWLSQPGVDKVLHLLLISLRIQPLIGHIPKGKPGRIDGIERKAGLFGALLFAVQLLLVHPAALFEHLVLVRIKELPLAIGTLIISRLSTFGLGALFDKLDLLKAQSLKLPAIWTGYIKIELPGAALPLFPDCAGL